jgi:hypothetical protein
VALEPPSHVRQVLPLIRGLQAPASRSPTSGTLDGRQRPSLFGGSTLPSEDVIGKEKDTSIRTSISAVN